AIAGSANAIYGIAEYWSKRKEIAALGREFYIYYVANRITGFQSHWMTFSGVEMILLLFLLSWALFAADSLKARLALGVAVLLIGTAVLLSDTRSVWLATAIGVVYLVARSQPKLLWTLPVIGVLIFFAAPENVQERVRSIWQPSQADSNSHRRAVNLIGVEMIRKHPWTGVGPGRVGKVYRQYIPSSLRGPLPEGYYDHLHSIYVHYAAERGLITAAGLVAWLLGSLVVLLRAAKGTEGVAAGLLHAGVAVTLAVMVEGAFELNLGDSEVLLLYLIVLALGFVAMRETHELKRT
ncbi:MAG TPA: O-antigen ligase family protein, partial [Bryobacteraceae bacterium]|nr:O-antigen ligase family protein [Bryobacteraceae bacterium]